MERCKSQSNWRGLYDVLLWTSNDRNGVAVILEREWHGKILKVDRIFNRIINVKLAYGNSILNVIAAYAPQVGCPHEEKSQFYEHLEKNNEEYQTSR